ncbi:hypothetical protein E4T56_gene14667 [Termitomyces sp. T112]|nr:hypothetical protein E4T56_gene14667 [Termitomyces sp. T112]
MLFRFCMGIKLTLWDTHHEWKPHQRIVTILLTTSFDKPRDEAIHSSNWKSIQGTKRQMDNNPEPFTTLHRSMAYSAG